MWWVQLFLRTSMVLHVVRGSWVRFWSRITKVGGFLWTSRRITVIEYTSVVRSFHHGPSPGGCVVWV